MRAISYAIRLPANAVLEREIEPFLTRPVGRPPRRPIIWYHDFLYQAKTWDRPRRVVAKIEWHRAAVVSPCGVHRHEPASARLAGGE